MLKALYKATFILFNLYFLFSFSIITTIFIFVKMASTLARTAHEEHLALIARLNDVLFIRHTSGNHTNTPITNTDIIVRPSGSRITYVVLNINNPAIRSEFQNLVLRMSVSIPPYIVREVY
jgi:hypothetical protein